MKKLVLISIITVSLFACAGEPSVSAEEKELQDQQDVEEQDDAFKDLEEGADTLLMQATEESIEEPATENK